MHLSDDLANGWLKSETISPDLFYGLDPRCVIALKSCCMAKYPNSLGYRTANASKRITFAADDLCYGIWLKQLDPLEFSHAHRGKPVKTKKIQPL
jgi:hypothetical protein